MAIKYRIVQKVNPSKPTDPRKYYATVVSRGEITLRDLAKEAAEISTVSIADMVASVEAILQVATRHVKQGDIVRLGELGSFSISVSSEGAATAEDFTSANIKSASMNFRPGKEIANTLNNLTFEKE
jgi:predicted histone-like DNA-binding protein